MGFCGGYLQHVVGSNPTPCTTTEPTAVNMATYGSEEAQVS